MKIFSKQKHIDEGHIGSMVGLSSFVLLSLGSLNQLFLCGLFLPFPVVFLHSLGLIFSYLFFRDDRMMVGF